MLNLHQTIMNSKLAVHKPVDPINKSVTLLLLASSMAVFAGRAYQHFYYDIPIRIVLWDQNVMEDVLLNVFNIPWDEFIRSSEWDSRIQSTVRTIGLVYFCCFAWCTQFTFRKSVRCARILLVGAAFLFFLAVLYSLDRFGRVGELMEYTCQWFAPIALFLMLRGGNSLLIGWGLRMTVALTFAGHGLYATGYYPIPGNFIDMAILGFGVNEDTAVRILAVAGWLDFLIAILIWFPATDRFAAFYAFLWGAVTAMARIWTNFDVQFIDESMSQWLFETVVRIPNALLPLAIFLFRQRVSQVTEGKFMNGNSNRESDRSFVWWMSKTY